MPWLWILFPLVLLLIVLLSGHLRITIHFAREDEQERLELKIRTLFGLLRIRRDLPLKRLSLTHPRKTKRLHILYRWSKNLLSRIECTHLQWITEIGIGDAADTAISTGFLWSTKNVAIGLLSKLIQVKTVPKLQVIPSYHHPQINTNLICTIQIRLIFLLMTGLMLAVRLLKNRIHNKKALWAG